MRSRRCWTFSGLGYAVAGGSGWSDPSPSVGRPAVTQRGVLRAIFSRAGPGEALLTQTSNVSALRGRAGDRRWVPIAVALVQGHALLLGRCRCGGCAGQDRSNRQHDR